MVTNNINNNDNYSDEEKIYIETIIEYQQKLTDATSKIGECCDKLIKLNEGVQYGDQTFKKIAKYPGINCSEQHLRHCWGYYRLMNNDAYQNANLKELSKRPTAVFPLCRIMDSELEEPKKVQLMKDIEAKAIKENLIVDEINQQVSEKLKERGQVRQRKEKPSKNDEEPAERDSAAECQKQFQQYDFTVKAVLKSKDLVKKVMSNQKNCDDLVSRFQNHAALLEKIPGCYRNKDLKKQIKDIADRLIAVAGKK